jgi:succinate dehydrogenase flavin-adding protein (antitoxin of CptAB toxin-antitoxin module)
MNYLTTFKKRQRLFWRSRKGSKLSDDKLARYYIEVFLREGSHENSRENQVDGVCILSLAVSSA